uniref:Histone H2A deubiquitinase MYSM1 n=1 Tax=Anthurium amnicola TaxID=1678845 RepID=A0A1D1YNM8_9ARAE
MAADSNMGFHQRMIPSSFYNHHMVSFQSKPGSSSSRISPTGTNIVGAVNSTSEMIYTGNPGGDNTSLGIPSVNAAGVLHLDPMPGLKHDTGLAVDWSLEEQSLLEKGLVKYFDEPYIMKYIKIAATLQNKTVRDVALRCRWMINKENGKRHKQEEYYTGKKLKDRKEKQVEFSSRADVVSSQPPNIPACSFMMQHVNGINGISREVSSIDGATRLLLEENAQVLCQIENNLDALKLQDNIDLFFHTKNNINTILNRMSEMPGIMSQMPPLPVSTNEEVVDAIFLGSSQVIGHDFDTS